MTDPDTLRPEVRAAINRQDRQEKCDEYCPVCEDRATIRAELLRLSDENARLNKIESLTTEQRLQMEDVELYLMDVSQPDDEDASWCDRMKSAIELLVQDCNYAVGQKNKAEAELAALNTRVFQGVVLDVDDLARGHAGLPSEWRGKRVRLVVEE